MTLHEILQFLPLASALVSALAGGLALRQGPHPLVAGSFVVGMWGMAAAEAATFLGRWAGIGRGPGIAWLQADLALQSMSTAAWIIFALVFGATDPQAALRRWRIPAALVLVLAFASAGSLALGLAGFAVRLPQGGETVFVLSRMGKGIFVFLIIGALAILVLLENAFRGADTPSRWRSKYLILGLMAGLGFQIYTSSEALLFGIITPGSAPGRSVVLLLSALLIGYSLTRRGLFGITVFVSRHFVYRSVTLSIVGVYLLAMGIAGEAVGHLGFPLDQSLKAVAVLVAAVGLALVLMSARFRRRLQLFIATNFYSHKYDYRRTWVDFTKRLSGAMRVEEILPRIAEMVGNTLWVRSIAIYTYDGESRAFDPAVAIGVKAPPVPAGHDGDLGEALRGRGQPVLPADLPALPLSSEARGALAALFARTGLVALVPMATNDALVGMIGLGPQASGKPFADEDWQLLATIADQAASAIAAARLAEQLLASREMEAFHRLSAFVMHDIKNAMAMLRPLLENARKFIGDPAFQRDALETLEGIAQRMDGLLWKLTGATDHGPAHHGAMDLNAVIRAARASCPIERWPGITLVENLSSLPVLWGDPGEMHTVVSNLLLNAAEALEGQPGTVTLRTAREAESVTLAVSDTGKGIDESFRRHGLFRPFRTTKAKGLGIGLYQCKAIVEAHGGRIEGASANGNGTTFTVRLPIRGEGERGLDAQGAGIVAGQRVGG